MDPVYYALNPAGKARPFQLQAKCSSLKTYVISGFISKLLSKPTPEILIQYTSCNKSVFLASSPGDSDAASLSLEQENWS